MAAEDPSEASVETQTSLGGGAHADRAHLPSSCLEWLSARLESAHRDVSVCATIGTDRVLLRVDVGATSSSIDQPQRDIGSLAELATAIRRWAKHAGHTVRDESSSGGEVRFALVPSSPKRS